MKETCSTVNNRFVWMTARANVDWENYKSLIWSTLLK